MIYAMSDIHGCLDKLETKMKHVDLEGDNRIVFLGDFMDYNRESCQVLEYVHDLQKTYDDKKVIALKGNHEAMFLEWIHEYHKPAAGEMESLMNFNDWLRTDFEYKGNTIRSFLTEEQFASLQQFAVNASFDEINQEAVRLVLSDHRNLISWIEKLPSYYETDKQIFVHAGVDEEAGKGWIWGSSDEMFLWTFQAAKGHFYKDVIAGHINTGHDLLTGNPDFHGVYHDGESHYYIDGGAYKRGGRLNLLAYDEEEEVYYSIQDDGTKERVKKYDPDF